MKHDSVQVDLRAGEHFGEAYRKVNPLSTVPALRNYAQIPDPHLARWRQGLAARLSMAL